ncbi:hypothetical protein GCM10022255_083880 [Dactylosporangium darangshiense]|uniref:Ankyrin repeat domain-containing protein n=2 Tax=Dactylosporangium darangshiense TaxID=579108 RepID=A0ABP8DM26_9ACTN
MVEESTRRRLAGDWRGACAAANVVLGASLEQALAGPSGARLDEDVRHLAPDLLRWYTASRPAWDQYTGITFHLRRPDGSIALSAEVSDRRGPLQIQLSPGAVWSRQAREPAELPPYRWDARRTADLRRRCGGATRTPFFDTAGRPLGADRAGGDGPEEVTERAIALHDAGRAAEAWHAAGFDLRVLLFEPEWGPVLTNPAALAGGDVERVRRLEADKALAGLRPIHAVLAEPCDEPVRLAWRGRCLVVDWPADARPRARLVPVPPDGHRDPARESLERAEFGRLLAEIPLVRPDAVRCPPELAGLLDGTVRRGDLHPLVQAALFPDAEPVPPRHPDPPRDRVEVPCAGAIHEVVMRDGAIHVPHTPDEIQRERVLATLGGRVQGCAAAVDGWRDPAIRMPRRMRNLRERVLDLVRHGDPEAMAAALDRGLDPHLRSESGATLLHLLPHFPGADLLPRLLAAGLDPVAEDRRGRTPKQAAADAYRHDLVDALRASGA